MSAQELISEAQMPSYILRNIEPELWAAFKARAATEGRGLRWIVLTLIRYYADHGMPGER